MSIMPQFREIEKTDLNTFRHLILPDIYEELNEQEEMESYICLAAWFSDTPVGAMITSLEDNGDISLLSV